MAFPNSIEAATYFQTAYDNLATDLTQELSPSDSTAYVTSTTNFPSIGWFTVGEDIRSYTGKTSGTFTGVVDGIGGTTPGTHAVGAAVSLTLNATAWNRVITELRAVMTALGAGFALTDHNTMGKNLLINQSFESHNITTGLPKGYTLLLTPTLAVAATTLFVGRGGNQITITGNGAADEGIQIAGGTANELLVIPSTEYTLAFDYKVNAGDTFDVVATSYNGASAGTAHVDAAITATSATRQEYTFTTDSDATNLALIFRAAADTDVCVLAHPKLEQGAVATPYVPEGRDRTVVRIETTNSTPDPACIARFNDHIITAQGDAPTISAPSGTAHDGDILRFLFEDDGTGRAITWNAIYEAIVSLPTTTTASKKLYVGYKYNAKDTKWDCVASSEEA